MKKLLLLALVLLGGITQVSAWNYLNGTFNSWADDANSCLDNGPVAVYLEASETPYQFGIDANGTWKGPNNNANISATTTITSFSGSGNFSLTVSTSGYYVFSTTWDNDNNLTLVVRYPDTTVYFYNALNWTNVYLHNGWWGDNDTQGANNIGVLRGVKMTAGENGIYSAYIPKESTYRVTFTPDKQVNDGTNDHGEGYTHFYSTSVVWNADQFDSSKPLYAPTTTLGATLNSCSYYYGGDWFSYSAPTTDYTRTVPQAKFGTICLPYDATVTGATLFKIKEKVMDGETFKGLNLESVTDLEAGKAYIFKADNSANANVTLTATLSGNFTAATLANGMIGNLSASALTVPADDNNYVVGTDNKIHKVVTVENGSGITIGQYKAYISLDNVGVTLSRGANFIDFGDNETTSIDMVQGEGLTVNGYYNLNGQRVAQPTKGLYIVNGKKAVVK